MRILVTGGSGYLGSALLNCLHATHPAAELFSTYFSKLPLVDFTLRSRLDLRDHDLIRRVVRTIQPNVIIHTAAQMQGSLEALRRVNAAPSGILSRLAGEIHARLIYLSTDLVFDGRRGNYREEDAPHPITDYGRSKFEAEGEVLDGRAEAVIVRTSLIYGFAPLDPRTRAALNGEMPWLFIDERRSPIWVESLCAALVELSEGDYTGILHVAGAQALNRYDFGVKLARALGGDENRLLAARSGESGLIRPLDCTLDCTRAQRLLETKLSGVDEVIANL
jgi:dTDP-4-dehydrorhamnose reductase